MGSKLNHFYVVHVELSSNSQHSKDKLWEANSMWLNIAIKNTPCDYEINVCKDWACMKMLQLRDRSIYHCLQRSSMTDETKNINIFV